MAFLYSKTNKKFIKSFESLFNNLTVRRESSNGKLKPVKLPINYAPGEKEYIYRLQRNDLRETKPAITFPRLTFDITSYEIDDSRKINKFNEFVSCNVNEDGSRNIIRAYTPYIVNIQLYMFSDILDDIFEIQERIMTGFRPAVYVKIVNENGIVSEVPIKFNGINKQDTYEGLVGDKRVIVYTFNFEAKVDYYMTTGESSHLIKKITLPFFNKNTNVKLETTTIEVDPSDANIDDDYNVKITTVQHIIEGLPPTSNYNYAIGGSLPIVIAGDVDNTYNYGMGGAMPIVVVGDVNSNYNYAMGGTVPVVIAGDVDNTYNYGMGGAIPIVLTS